MNHTPELRLSKIVRSWYDINKRDLPWRKTNDPYLIWLSEVILQQTRVDQGLDYYTRITKRFPDVKSLAQAKEDEILKLWQGLGYYSRARNLHTAAKTIEANFGGNFPHTYKDVLSLKGVGIYTASAIASFAYNQPYAAVDGNVYRVLSRIFGIDTPINTPKGQKEFEELAQAVLDPDAPGIHNQAMMEFGALQCTPVSPNCSTCPVSDFCTAYSQNNQSSYPVKQGKNKQKPRYFSYFHITQDEYIYMYKRTQEDIWKNLYELPLIETKEDISPEKLLESPSFSDIFGDIKFVLNGVFEVKHILSHQIIYARFFHLQINSESELSKQYIKIKTQNLDTYAISRLTHKYFEKTGGSQSQF